MKEEICIVCGHKLINHLSEGEDGWRCHSLSRDGFQCECFLRKDRAEGGRIEYYGLNKRIAEVLDEQRKGEKEVENAI